MTLSHGRPKLIFFNFEVAIVTLDRVGVVLFCGLIASALSSANSALAF